MKIMNQIHLGSIITLAPGFTLITNENSKHSFLLNVAGDERNDCWYRKVNVTGNVFGVSFATSGMVFAQVSAQDLKDIDESHLLNAIQEEIAILADRDRYQVTKVELVGDWLQAEF